MVVWLSCYAFVPVVFMMAYDKMKKLFNKCCKKKTSNKINENISKEETNKLNEEIKNKEENSRKKIE